MFPDGCGRLSGDTVRLDRSLHGLKQAGRQWSVLLANVEIGDAVEQSKSDIYVLRFVQDDKVILTMADMSVTS